MAVLAAQFLLFFILSKITFAIDFFSALFEWKKNFHIFLFSWLHFSVGDLLYSVIILWLCFVIFNLIKKKRRKGLHSFLIFANIFYFIYQCFWGMLYFQKPIYDKLAKKEISEQNLKKLAVKYLNLSRSTRENVSENKDGIFIISNIDDIKKEIMLKQTQLPTNLNSKKAIRHFSVKASFYKNVMNYTGILGYYNPFTAEAQYNPNLPATQLPFTLAHEMSHQLGYAREQEASFVAFLCAEQSDNQDFRYSTQLYVLKSVLRNLNAKDPAFVKQILSKYSDKMKRDRANDLNFYKKYDGAMSEIFGITNDFFLKSNQQEGRVTYSYFLNLMVAYEG